SSDLSFPSCRVSPANNGLVGAAKAKRLKQNDPRSHTNGAKSGLFHARSCDFVDRFLPFSYLLNVCNLLMKFLINLTLRRSNTNECILTSCSYRSISSNLFNLLLRH